MMGGGVVLAGRVLNAVSLHPLLEFVLFLGWMPVVIVYSYRLLRLGEAKVTWDIVLASDREHRIEVVWRYMRGSKITIAVDGEATEARRLYGAARDTREFDFGAGPRHHAVLRFGLIARPRRRLDLEVDGEELLRI